MPFCDAVVAKNPLMEILSDRFVTYWLVGLRCLKVCFPCMLWVLRVLKNSIISLLTSVWLTYNQLNDSGLGWL